MNTEKIMKWLARLSALFLLARGFDSGISIFNEMRATTEFYLAIWIPTLLMFSMYAIPSLPLWYYGFRKANLVK